MICTDWICRKCRGVINTTLMCRACGAIYTLAELQYEWPPSPPPSAPPRNERPAEP